ncbi:MAG: S41 family peptidase [Syntrophobacteraceae bacterium]|jgi:carboxyl-terminal processing protease
MRTIVTGAKLIRLIISVTAAVSGSIIGGVMLDRLVLADFVPARNIQKAPEPDFKLISEAWNIISKNYVDRQAVQPQKLTYGAISGMVNALGDTGHSSFLSPEMLSIESHFLQGNFSGIGAQIKIKEGHIVILAPMDGSPAQHAGLQSGDIILRVNGEDITGLPVEQAVTRIAGKPGTSVTLTILNPRSGQSREITIVRAEITVRNVRWHRLAGSKVAHMRIAGFSQGVAEEVRKALREVRNKSLTALILDLRDNPGGVFDEAVGAASQFLSGGNVVLEKNGKGDVKPVPVEPGGLAPGIPLVVLINGGSASGSEIVAGALKDAHRAKLVGEKTFGAGTLLQGFGLSDGSAMLLAIAEWITPAGHIIWHKGVTPDVEVGLPVAAIPLYPDREKGMNSAQLKASEDTQLLRALELLEHPESG